MTLKDTWAKGDKFTAADQNAVSAAVNDLSSSKEDKANRNVANGYAGLDASGRVATAQLPPYFNGIDGGSASSIYEVGSLLDGGNA